MPPSVCIEIIAKAFISAVLQMYVIFPLKSK